MAKITSIHSSGNSAGTIVPCGTNTALPRTLLCNGAAISRPISAGGTVDTYKALYSAIGTTFGSGDGSTTFNLPNLQGVFPRGAGTQNRYTFTVTSANATAGAVYSNNSQTFTVMSTISSSTTLVTNGSGAPLASGTLTKVSGVGDATITFSANIEVTYSATNGNHQADKMQGHLHNLTNLITLNTTGSGNGLVAGASGVSFQPDTASPKTDSVNGNPRTGSETAPANLGVNYCIAY